MDYIKVNFDQILKSQSIIAHRPNPQHTHVLAYKCLLHPISIYFPSVCSCFWSKYQKSYSILCKYFNVVLKEDKKFLK